MAPMNHATSACSEQIQHYAVPTYGEALHIIDNLNTEYQVAIRFLLGKNSAGEVQWDVDLENQQARDRATANVTKLCAHLRTREYDSPDAPLKPEDQRILNAIVGIMKNYSARAAEATE